MKELDLSGARIRYDLHTVVNKIVVALPQLEKLSLAIAQFSDSETHSTEQNMHVYTNSVQQSEWNSKKVSLDQLQRELPKFPPGWLWMAQREPPPISTSLRVLNLSSLHWQEHTDHKPVTLFIIHSEITSSSYQYRNNFQT